MTGIEKQVNRPISAGEIIERLRHFNTQEVLNITIFAQYIEYLKQAHLSENGRPEQNKASGLNF